MKPVERYRAELDAISAPAALKETLYAIPAQYPIAQDAPAISDTQNTRYATNAPDMPAAQNAPNPSGTTDAKPKKAIRFALPPNWKRYALTAAACFVLGVLVNDPITLQLTPQTSTENASVASATAEEAHLGDAVAPMDNRAYDLAAPAEGEAIMPATVAEDEAAMPATVAERDASTRSADRHAAPAKAVLSAVVLSILLIFSGAALALMSIFVYDRTKKKHLAS